jgi:hypothetical protein
MHAMETGVARSRTRSFPAVDTTVTGADKETAAVSTSRRMISERLGDLGG